MGAFEAAEHGECYGQGDGIDCLTGARRRRPWRLGTPATMANGDRGSNRGGEVRGSDRELTRNSTEVVVMAGVARRRRNQQGRPSGPATARARFRLLGGLRVRFAALEDVDDEEEEDGHGGGA